LSRYSAMGLSVIADDTRGIKSTGDSMIAKKWQPAAATQCVPLDLCGDPWSQGSPDPAASCTIISYPGSTAAPASCGVGTCRIPTATTTTTTARLIRRMSADHSPERLVGCRFNMIVRNKSLVFCASALIQINCWPHWMAARICDRLARSNSENPVRKPTY